jgi:hypothetical protein
VQVVNLPIASCSLLTLRGWKGKTSRTLSDLPRWTPRYRRFSWTVAACGLSTGCIAFGLPNGLHDALLALAGARVLNRREEPDELFRWHRP